MKARFIELSSITALGVLGCYAVEESHTNDLLPLEREIESALPEGASILWKVSPHERPTAIESVTWSMRDGGSLLVPYYRDGADLPTGLPPAIYVTRDGRALPLHAEEGEAVFSVSSQSGPPSVTPCGEEAIVRICDGGASSLWVTDVAGGAIHRSDAALGDCESSVLGAALGEDRFVTIRGPADAPLLTEWSCSAGDIREGAEPLALPSMPALPRWVEEVEPSVFAWVRHQPGMGELDFGDWVHERSDASGTVRVPRTELPFPTDTAPTRSWERVRREPSGALLVDGISGLYRWHVEDSGEVEPLGIAPPPSPEFSPWTHVGLGAGISSRVDWNPDGVQLEMPLEYEVLGVAGDGYQTSRVPSTPCRTREVCRRIGESYLRGRVETASGPLGLYVMWTWQLHPVPYGESTAGSPDLATLILAPLDRPLP